MLVLRSILRGIPQAMVCRILMFMWGFWAPILAGRSQDPSFRKEAQLQAPKDATAKTNEDSRFLQRELSCGL